MCEDIFAEMRGNWKAGKRNARFQWHRGSWKTKKGEDLGSLSDKERDSLPGDTEYETGTRSREGKGNMTRKRGGGGCCGLSGKGYYRTSLQQKNETWESAEES